MMSPRQRLAINHATSPHVLFNAVGAVRSGKTVASAAAHAAFALAKFPYHDHLVMGVTETSAMRNVVNSTIGTLSILRSLGYRPKISGVGGRHVRVPRPGGRVSKIWIMGGNDERAADRVAGMTLATANVDEVVRIPESVFQMVWTRLSVEGAKMWCSMNPAATGHWFKKQVIDKPEDYDAVSVKYTMDDNPSLSEEVKQRIKRGLTGHWKTRLADGEWADLSGLIFPEWYGGDMPDPVQRWSVSVDWASSGTFAALLTAHGKQRSHFVSERIYDAHVHGPINEVEQAEQTSEWVREYVPDGDVPLIGDPSTSAGFQKEMSGKGFDWVDAENDVVEGLKAAATAFVNKRYTIGNCPHLKKEMGEYHWDPKAAERGEDKPVKTKDHACDAARYEIYTPKPTLDLDQWLSLNEMLA